MGNTSFMSTGAFVAVQLDQQGKSICGGSKLRGSVFLSVAKDSVSADSLNVKFYGREATCVQYTVTVDDGEGKSHTETRSAHDDREIISIELVLCTYPGSIRKGTYEYPFEITLPVGLPGKHGLRGHSNWFVVEYFFEAKLHRHGMLTWDVKNAQEVLLADQPYIDYKTPSYVEPSRIPVYFMCCFNTGTMTLVANVDSTNVCVEDRVNIRYALHNESTTKIKALEVRVDMTERFSAGGHTHASTRAIFKQRVDASQLEGVAPVTNRGDSSTAPVSVALISEFLRKEMDSHSVSGVLMADRPSYRGMLGSISFEVDVQAITTFGSQNPQISIPLLVHRSRVDFSSVVPIVEVDFTRPPEWNAVPAQLVYLNTPTPAAVAVSNPIESSSVAWLIQQLQAANQWTEESLLREWLSFGALDQLAIPDSLATVFRCIKGEYSYSVFPESIGAALKTITTTQIAAAAASVPEHHKASVCYTFSRYCSDKPNAPQAFVDLGLPPYAFESVLAQYR